MGTIRIVRIIRIVTYRTALIFIHEQKYPRRGYEFFVLNTVSVVRSSYSFRPYSPAQLTNTPMPTPFLFSLLGFLDYVGKGLVIYLGKF